MPFLLKNCCVISSEHASMPKGEGFLFNETLLPEWNVHSSHSYKCAYTDTFT